MQANSKNDRKIHVLVVDDSAVVRQVMEAVLSHEREFSIMVAADPLIAFQKMRKTRPDVIILDLEMPRMDGLTFLRKIMTTAPIPTLVCSGITGHGTDAALRALEEGAIGIVTKPKLGVRNFLHESAVMLIDMVRSAARARLCLSDHRSTSKVAPKFPTAVAHTSNPLLPLPRVVAVGASTGGTEALTKILNALPLAAPGIAIVQHMPELFTAAFARRLDQSCEIEVKEAEDGDCITPGHAFIAPGNRHMSVQKSRGDYILRISDGPLVSRHRPSVDVLFKSVAAVARKEAMGILLTGMGNDGANGLLEMKLAGASTIAQDESTSVVFGMPKEAIALKAADIIAPLPMIPSLITGSASKLPHRTRMIHRIL